MCSCKLLPLSETPLSYSTCLISDEHPRSYAFGFIQLILAEENTVVVNVYYIISVIITDLFYLANILLLVTIFALVFHFFSPSNDEGKATKKKILWAHYAFCAILLAMFCALLGMSLYRVITSINRYGEPYLYSGRTAITQSYYKLDVAFDSLLFVASFEILLGSAWLIPRSRAKQLSIKVSPHCVISIMKMTNVL